MLSIIHQAIPGTWVSKYSDLCFQIKTKVFSTMGQYTLLAWTTTNAGHQLLPECINELYYLPPIHSPLKCKYTQAHIFHFTSKLLFPIRIVSNPFGWMDSISLLQSSSNFTPLQHYFSLPSTIRTEEKRIFGQM